MTAITPGNVELPARITGASLNTLSEPDRIAVLKGPFGRRMHAWAGSYVSYIRWEAPSILRSDLTNGSIFFLDICGRLLAVTAAHVFNGYLADKRRLARTICHVGNTQFDPERRLVGLGSNVDIATFDFTYDDLRKLGKQAMVITDAQQWPPPHPFPGQAAFFGDLPGASRIWLNWRSVSFGLYTASPRINSTSDRQITCPFERDLWIDVTGRGLPPSGFKLGGLSGGPLLIPSDTNGVGDFYSGGVISEPRVHRLDMRR